MNRLRALVQKILAFDTRLHSAASSKFPRVFHAVDRILEAFLAFVSNPVFAVIAALLLVPLVDSGKISVVNAICAWGAWIVAVVWISRKLKSFPIFSRVVTVFGLAGILAGGSSAFVRWSARAYLASQNETGFNFVFRSELVDMRRNTDDAALWVEYNSGYGASISPVSVWVFLDMTNKESFANNISSYVFSIKTERCGWIYLSPIPAEGNRLSWGYNGFDSMVEMNTIDDALDAQWKTDFGPHETRSGFLMFDTKEQCTVPRGSLVQFRMETIDSLGNRQTFETPEVAIQDNEFSGTTEGTREHARFQMDGYLIDASQSYRRMECDPVPDALPAGVSGAGKVVLRWTGKQPIMLLNDGPILLYGKKESEEIRRRRALEDKP